MFELQLRKTISSIDDPAQTSTDLRFACMAGYQPSAALMQRLTPRRAEILSDLNHPWGLNTPAHLRGRYVHTSTHIA
jgi:hypothetical protein